MTATATGRADFAARLYEKLGTAAAGKNLFASPFSIQAALAMCAAGAKGHTRKALIDVIGEPEAPARDGSSLALRAQGVDLAVANALWGQQGFRFHTDYKKTIAVSFDGAFNEVNFRDQPDQAVQTINAWVEGKTAGKIKDLISRGLIDSMTRLIVTNAVYFKGKWDSEFDKSHTWDEAWHGPGGDRKVPMMQQRHGYLFYESDALQAIDLPYRGERLSMLVVLPRKMDGLAEVEHNWTGANTYQRVTAPLAHEETVVVSLPRFKIESGFKLKPVLCELGAAAAFNGDADFSGISSEPLTIAEVVHKAFVDVNEEGTEAAAATGAVMAKCAMPSEPKRFRADHPFLFVIRDRATNAILFGGRVLEP